MGVQAKQSQWGSNTITIQSLLQGQKEIKNNLMIFSKFKLSRVKLNRNDLQPNKNYFELAGGSSHQGFELPRVELQ